MSVSLVVVPGENHLPTTNEGRKFQHENTNWTDMILCPSTVKLYRSTLKCSNDNRGGLLTRAGLSGETLVVSNI